MSLWANVVPPPGVVRVLCLSNLAKTIGNGVLLSVGVLYFIRAVQVPAGQVGVALTIGAAVGMVVGVPAGHAADLLGPRLTTVAFMVLQGLLICGYAFVTGFAGLVVAASLVLAAEAATDAARGALIAGVVPPGERVTAWSYLRVMANIGVSLGAVAGGVALHFDSRPVYVGLLVGAGLLLVVAGIAYLTLPHVPPAQRPEDGPRWEVLRDRPFAVVSVLNAVLVMNTGILTVALPVWIAERTGAPTWVYSVVLLVNTVVVVLLQVRVGRTAEDVPGGARAFRRSGLALAACCAVFALARGGPTWVAVAVLLVGALVHVIGELFYSAGSWSLSFGLAPRHAQGQYQGLFGMSGQLGQVVTPVVATTLVLAGGWWGWLAFGAVLAGAGLAAPGVARWAERTRRPVAA
ncbi:MFS transporter [Actinosynnema sp. NPDC053489]|uniref:MFS transporter n=1 Tax=Actinosynnema sp. NPDC053489 TaxID=3363916 RepID=UPI0037CAD8D9